MSTIPKDPIILFSWINTMLRDKYQSLDELCSDFELDKNELEKKLRTAGFLYEPAINQFR